jgi:hypothetical protein
MDDLHRNVRRLGHPQDRARILGAIWALRGYWKTAYARIARYRK